MSVLYRGKKVLKEKVVQLYEGFFRGEQVTLGNANFWEEFFLIKPKIAALETEIGGLQVTVHCSDNLACLMYSRSLFFALHPFFSRPLFKTIALGPCSALAL
jgi:hypothetical protein